MGFYSVDMLVTNYNIINITYYVLVQELIKYK